LCSERRKAIIASVMPRYLPINSAHFENESARFRNEQNRRKTQLDGER
jgi:hypothetical protein